MAVYYRSRAQLSLPPGLLKSNYVPTPREVRRIHSIITQKRQFVDELNEQRDQAYAFLLSIEDRIRAVEEEIAEHRALLTPARRVPLELLWQIFHHSASDWSQAPLVLSAVCRRWRDAVFAEPSLWQSISLPSAIESRYPIPSNPLSLTKTFIERSAGCPVDLSIDFEQLNLDDSKLDTLFLLLSSQQHRWRDVDIRIPDVHIQQLFDSSTRSAPLLKNLRIEATRTHRLGSSAPAPIISAMPLAPQLETLRLTGMSIKWSALWSLISSDKLRTLILKDVRGSPAITMDTVLDIIDRCPTLERLEIPLNVLNDRLHHHRFAGPMRRPALKEFRLELYTPLDCGPIFAHLDLPQLTVLTLNILGGGVVQTSGWPDFGAMLARSKPPLMELSLCGFLDLPSVPDAESVATGETETVDGAGYPKSQLLRDLTCIPTLRRLTLRHSSIGNDIFDQMIPPICIPSDTPPTGDNAVTPILPNLTHLTLEHCNSFAVDALIAMLVSRNGLPAGTSRFPSAPSPLERLHVDMCSQMRVNHCALIQSMAIVDTTESKLHTKLFFYEGTQRYEMAYPRPGA